MIRLVTHIDSNGESMKDEGKDSNNSNTYEIDKIIGTSPKILLFFKGIQMKSEFLKVDSYTFFQVSGQKRVTCEENPFGLNSIFEVACKLDDTNFGLVIPSVFPYCCVFREPSETNFTQNDRDLMSALMLMGLNDVFLMGIGDYPLNSLTKHSFRSTIGSHLILDDESIVVVNDLYARIQKASKWKRNIISSFDESMYSENLAYKFIALVMALEGLIQGNNELSYRISRHVAVLIGNSESDSKDIFRFIKEMYGIRSKHVHGENVIIKLEDYVKLYHLVRRVIIKILYFDKDQKNLEDILTAEGYGSNPVESPEYPVYEKKVQKSYVG